MRVLVNRQLNQFGQEIFEKAKIEDVSSWDIVVLRAALEKLIEHTEGENTSINNGEQEVIQAAKKLLGELDIHNEVPWSSEDTY